MSDLLLNVRFWHWHLQFSKARKFEILRNGFHHRNGWPDGKFRVYQLWPFR